MNAYYSSDEDIAWGPITLREIKRDLRRPIFRKIGRRRTIQPLTTVEMKVPPSLCTEVSEKCHISSTHEDYHTANDETEVCEQTETSTDYLTALDTTNPIVRGCNTTLMEFVKDAYNRTSSDIQDIHQTLVENTLLTPKESFESNCSNTSTSSRNEVVVISSDEDEPEENGVYDEIKSEKHSYLVNLSTEGDDYPEKDRSSGDIEEDLSMYKRNISVVVDSSEDDEEDLSVYKRNISVVVDSSEDEAEENVEAASSVHENFGNVTCNNSSDIVCIGNDQYCNENQVDLEREVDGSNEVQCCDEDAEQREDLGEKDIYQHYNESSSSSNCEKPANYEVIVDHHNETTHEPRHDMPSSPVTVPDIDLAQFDDSSYYCESSQLDNTLDRIDRLLRQGQEMSDCETENIPESKEDNIISASFLQIPILELSSKHTVTPLKENRSNFRTPKCTTYKKESSSEHGKAKSQKTCISHIPKYRKSPGDNFKVPLTPVVQRMPHKASPKIGANFKNIVSPVGLYIKYSPQPILKKNITSNDMKPTNIFPYSSSSSNQVRHKNKNLEDLPPVMYKPAKKQIVTADRKQPLPASVEKMIKSAHVVKHNKKTQHTNPATIEKKIALETDLTVGSFSESVLEGSSIDVSILHRNVRPYK